MVIDHWTLVMPERNPRKRLSLSWSMFDEAALSLLSLNILMVRIFSCQIVSNLHICWDINIFVCMLINTMNYSIIYFNFHLVFPHFITNVEKQQAQTSHPIIDTLQKSYPDYSQKQNTIYVGISIVVPIKFLTQI